MDIIICIVLGIPFLFLYLCIENIVKIVKLKKAKEVVKKSLIIETIIWGILFVLIVLFYIWIYIWVVSTLTKSIIEHM